MSNLAQRLEMLIIGGIVVVVALLVGLNTLFHPTATLTDGNVVALASLGSSNAPPGVPTVTAAPTATSLPTTTGTPTATGTPSVTAAPAVTMPTAMIVGTMTTPATSGIQATSMSRYGMYGMVMLGSTILALCGVVVIGRMRHRAIVLTDHTILPSSQAGAIVAPSVDCLTENNLTPEQSIASEPAQTPAFEQASEPEPELLPHFAPVPQPQGEGSPSSVLQSQPIRAEPHIAPTITDDVIAWPDATLYISEQVVRNDQVASEQLLVPATTSTVTLKQLMTHDSVITAEAQAHALLPVLLATRPTDVTAFVRAIDCDSTGIVALIEHQGAPPQLLSAWADALTQSVQARCAWHRDGLHVPLTAHVSHMRHSPAVVPLLRVGRRQRTIRCLPIVSWQHLGLYGGHALDAAHHVLTTLVCQQAPSDIALLLLDPTHSLGTTYAQLPHVLPTTTTPAAVLYEFLDRLTAGDRLPACPLYIVLVEPDSATCGALEQLLQWLRHVAPLREQSIPLHVLFVQTSLHAAGREIYASLPALLTPSRTNDSAWLPGHPTWPTGDQALFNHRHWRWQGTPLLLTDETVAATVQNILHVRPAQPLDIRPAEEFAQPGENITETPSHVSVTPALDIEMSMVQIAPEAQQDRATFAQPDRTTVSILDPEAAANANTPINDDASIYDETIRTSNLVAMLEAEKSIDANQVSDTVQEGATAQVRGEGLPTSVGLELTNAEPTTILDTTDLTETAPNTVSVPLVVDDEHIAFAAPKAQADGPIAQTTDPGVAPSNPHDQLDRVGFHLRTILTDTPAPATPPPWTEAAPAVAPNISVGGSDPWPTHVPQVSARSIVADGRHDGLSASRLREILASIGIRNAPLGLLLVWFDRAGLLEAAKDPEQPFGRPRRFTSTDMTWIAHQLSLTPIPSPDDPLVVALSKAGRR